MTLTRENIRNGFIRKMMEEAPPGFRMLSEEELESSLAGMFPAGRPEGDVWLFGYGSLIWNPAFHFAERRIGTVRGLHRRFCLWTTLGRGTPERPGLMLALDRGGSCKGVAFRIEADKAAEELQIVWRREMVSHAYIPRWVTVQTDGGPVRAITFTINRRHERYVGQQMADAEAAKVIAVASGRIGRCAEYLENTVQHLHELKIADRYMERLLTLTRQACGEQAAQEKMQK